MATDEPRTPPTACAVLSPMRAAASAIAEASAAIEACAGRPLSADDLGLVQNACRLTRVAHGTVAQVERKLDDLLHALNQVAVNVA